MKLLNEEKEKKRAEDKLKRDIDREKHVIKGLEEINKMAEKEDINISAINRIDSLIMYRECELELLEKKLGELEKMEINNIFKTYKRKSFIEAVQVSEENFENVLEYLKNLGLGERILRKGRALFCIKNIYVDYWEDVKSGDYIEVVFFGNIDSYFLNVWTKSEFEEKHEDFKEKGE